MDPGRMSMARTERADLADLAGERWPTAHRPWPLPERPWILAQTWRDLLFAHWPVEPARLRPLIPPPFELETFGGEAWVGVVPFHMTGVRVRGTPALPRVSCFPELNVRTYVRHGGKSGVWFFGLDCAQRLAVAAARLWYRLPYFRARMEWSRGADGFVDFRSRRVDPRAGPGELRIRYGPTAPVSHAASGGLDHWLTERYCLYACGRGKRPLRAEIHHAPWPLQPAVAEIEVNDVTRALGIELPSVAPLLHYAERLDVRIWNVRSALR